MNVLVPDPHKTQANPLKTGAKCGIMSAGGQEGACQAAQESGRVREAAHQAQD